MAEPSEKKIERPEDMPRTPPPIYPGVDYSFVLQVVIENQRTLGELKTAIENMSTTVNNHGGKIDMISHRVYAAGAVLIVLLAIGGFILNKVWDNLIALLAASGTG